MKAKSIKGQNLDEFSSALTEAISDGFTPTLAIVFSSISQDNEAIASKLGKKDIKVFGVTTNGEFIDGELGEKSIVAMLLDLKPEYFEVHFTDYADLNYRKATQGIAKKVLETIANPGFFISGTHLETDAEELLRGIEDIIGKDVNVFGAMAGDDFTFVDQFVFTNGKMGNRSVVVLAIDEDKIEMKGNAICGWKAMGIEKTVTKSVGNVVYTIDDIPALDITAKYGGLEAKKENSNLLTEIATLCPLQLQRPNGKTVMRPGLFVNWEDRSFICSGSVPQGSKVKFSLPPDFDAIEKVIEGSRQLKENIIPDPDALIYFTCAGRLLTFGPLMSKEVGALKEIWDVPMVGMFSNAELGRAIGGYLEMHNLTSCVVALKEK
jgi:hypothetical protein